MTEERKLDLILHRDADDKLKLWACRGVGKGCARNRFRKSKAPCADCMGPLDEKLTMEEVLAKLETGDA